MNDDHIHPAIETGIMKSPVEIHRQDDRVFFGVLEGFQKKMMTRSHSANGQTLNFLGLHIE